MALLADKQSKLQDLHEDDRKKEGPIMKMTCNTASEGAFVEAAVTELSRQHEDEINVMKQEKEGEINSISNSLVTHDNRRLVEQIDELKDCFLELTTYMKRTESFIVPTNTTEFCESAKCFIVSNQATTLAELESKHMVELDQCKVQYENSIKKLEVNHAYNMRDEVAKYDLLLFEKEDEHQDQLRAMDEKIYNLESELTMLKGTITKDETSPAKESADNDIHSSSNEFIVHVTKHASPPFKDTNKVEEELSAHTVLQATPKKDAPRRSVSAGAKRSQSLKQKRSDKAPLRRGASFSAGQKPPGTSGIRPPKRIQKPADNDTPTTKPSGVKTTPTAHQASQTVSHTVVHAPTQTTCYVVHAPTQTTCNVAHAPTQTLVSTGVNEYTQTVAVEQNKTEKAISRKSKYDIHVEEIDELWNDLVPIDECYLGDLSFGLMDSFRTPDPIAAPDHTTDNIATDNQHTDNLLETDDILATDTDDNLLDSRDLFAKDDEDVMSHDLTAKVLALQAINSTLKEELSCCVPVSAVRELEEHLHSNAQELAKLRTELEGAVAENARLHMLNAIHIENEIAKVAAQPVRLDTACSPIIHHLGDEGDHLGDNRVDIADVNTDSVLDNGVPQHTVNLTSLLARLALDESRLGSKSVIEEDSLCPDLSFFDLTLTTELANTTDSNNQTLLIAHLCEIQAEAMKIQGRSEELCKDNEKLHKQVESLTKSVELERNKVRSKIKELVAEREKAIKLDAQLKANKEIHKKKLEEVFAFHQKELDQLTAEKDLTEEQARSLAKLLNEEPTKDLVSTDCQTSMIFSNFVLHMNTDPNQGCPAQPDITADNNTAAVREELEQLKAEHATLMEHTAALEDSYGRQNCENNALLEIMSTEKRELENQLFTLQGQVKEAEEILLTTHGTNGANYAAVSIDEGVGLSHHDLTAETLNFTQLSNLSELVPGEEGASSLPGATRHLVGMFKTSSEQVADLQQALLSKSTAHQEVLRNYSSTQIALQTREAELSNLRAQMADEDTVKVKLLDANKVIAKLKGEILKLSTEVENGQINNAGEGDVLVEENEELKKQVDKLEEIKATLLNDVQILREQLDEEQAITNHASRELVDANNDNNDLKSEQGRLLQALNVANTKNADLEEKVRTFQDQLAQLQDQIKQDKNITRDLLARAEDATVTRHEADVLREEMEKLQGELRRRRLEVDELQDNNGSLKKKLNILKPSLDSYEEENLNLKEKLKVSGARVLVLQDEIGILEAERDALHSSLLELQNVKKISSSSQTEKKEEDRAWINQSEVNSSLKDKLKESKAMISEFEERADAAERVLRKVKLDLHETKENLGTSEEKVEKLQTQLEELQTLINVRKKTTASQAAVSMYEVGSTCNLLDSSADPDLQAKYDELWHKYQQINQDVLLLRQQKADAEAQIQNLYAQQSAKELLMLQLQQDHAHTMERLRATLTSEKENALGQIRTEMEQTKQKLSESHRSAMEDLKTANAAENAKRVEKIVSEMEKKSQQDSAMIARKVGLDPTSLSTLLPGSTQLSDRIEALHNQALQIRNLALAFYDASHPPTKEVSIQAAVKMFKCATQTVERKPSTDHVTDKPPPPSSSDGGDIKEFIRVFKEEHAKQTEMLISQIKQNDKPESPTEKLDDLKGEVERLKLSVETYTTRCSILEHNNRLLKDRNTGLENDMMVTATKQNSFLLLDDDQDDTHRLYDSHAEQRNHSGSLRKRLANCQNEVNELQNTVAEYQEALEQLDVELEEERGMKQRAEHRMRNAESALIEIKNDRILQEDEKIELFNQELQQTKENNKLLDTENKRLKGANGKLKNLNISLLESNQKLKNLDEDNFMMNVSNKSTTLIHEIDSIKAVEDLKFELVAKETELDRKINRITVLESEIDTKTNTISAQRDELDSKHKVIKLIKSELSAQQLDVAEIKAMFDIERSKSHELERRLKEGRPGSRSEVEDLFKEVQHLKARNSQLMKEQGACDTPSSSRRVTRAYVKFLRAESARKALVFQKQYLLSLLSKARAVESAALSILEIKKDGDTKKRKTFKHVAVMVIALIRMKNLVKKWNKVKQSIEDKQRSKVTPSTFNSSQLTDHRPLYSHQREPLKFDLSQHSEQSEHRELSPINRSRNVSIYSGYPKWDSGRPISPPSHPRDGISNRVYGSPSPDPSLSRLDQQLERLRNTINTRNSYDRSPDARSRDFQVRSRDLTRVSNEHVIPERDSGIIKPSDEDGTLSDISNYISRLEAVQSRLTDLKLSSYKIYESNT